MDGYIHILVSYIDHNKHFISFLHTYITFSHGVSRDDGMPIATIDVIKSLSFNNREIYEMGINTTAQTIWILKKMLKVCLCYQLM